jgi:hypothetical protein
MENEINEETLNPLEFNRNNNSIDSNSDGDSPKKINQRPKPCKFEGSRKMLVKLEKLKTVSEIPEAPFDYHKHYCHYYGSLAANKCPCASNSCLSCDYKYDHLDSLDTCFPKSPNHGTGGFDLPKFDSPTLVKDTDIINDTFVGPNEIENANDTSEGLDDSLQSDTSSLYDNDGYSALDESDRSSSPYSPDLVKRAKINEMKLQSAFDDMNNDCFETENFCVDDESFEPSNTGNKDANSSKWFCPNEIIPHEADLVSNKLNQRNAIAVYTNETSKKWVNIKFLTV